TTGSQNTQRQADGPESPFFFPGQAHSAERDSYNAKKESCVPYEIGNRHYGGAAAEWIATASEPGHETNPGHTAEKHSPDDGCDQRCPAKACYGRSLFRRSVCAVRHIVLLHSSSSSFSIPNMRSMRSMISGVSLGATSVAFMFSCTCSTRLAPVMTVLTNGFFKHHAIESCASVQPSSFAIGSSALTLASLS